MVRLQEQADHFCRLQRLVIGQVATPPHMLAAARERRARGMRKSIKGTHKPNLLGSDKKLTLIEGSIGIKPIYAMQYIAYKNVVSILSVLFVSVMTKNL